MRCCFGLTFIGLLGACLAFATGCGRGGADGGSTTAPSASPAGVLPAPKSFNGDGEVDGVFRGFAVVSSRARGGELNIRAELVRETGPVREVHMGARKVAKQPSDADFADAAVWRLKLPSGLDARRDVILRVRYDGEVARGYLDGKLLTDNFYNGSPFDTSLKGYGPDAAKKDLLLKILPLRKDAPIYLAKEAVPDFGSADSVARIKGVELIEMHAGQLGGK